MGIQFGLVTASSVKSLFFVVFSLFVLNSANAQASKSMNASVEHGSDASAHSAASAGNGLAASGQLTSAVSAVPLSAAGVASIGVGSASVGVAAELSDLANTPIGSPLPVSDENFSIIPPNEALKKE